MSFSIRCPGCKGKLKLGEKHLGRVVTCPKCSKEFKLPAAKTQPPAIPDRPQTDPSPSEGGDVRGNGVGELANLDLPDFSAPSATVAPTPSFPVSSPAGGSSTADKSTDVEQSSTQGNRLILLGASAVGVMVIGLMGSAIWFFTSGEGQEKAIAQADPPDRAVEEVIPANIPAERTSGSDSMSADPASDDAASDNASDDAASDDASRQGAAKGGPQQDAAAEAESDEDSPTGSREPARFPSSPSRSDLAIKNRNQNRVDNSEVVPVESGETPLVAELVAHDGPGYVVQVHPGSNHCVFSPETGQLAFAQHYHAAVYFLHKELVDGDTSAFAGPIKLPNTGRSPWLCFKQWQGRTLLAASAEDKIWILDPKTGSLAETDPAVQQIFDVKPYHLNASTLASRKPQSRRLWVNGDADDARIFFEREHELYYRSSWVDVATGEIVFGGFGAPDDYQVHQRLSFPEATDPYGVIDANELNNLRMEFDPADERRKKQNGEVDVLLVMRDHPWIVARDHSKLFLIQRSNRTQFTSIELPQELHLAESRSDRSSAFYDRDRDRLLIWGGEGSTRSALWVLPMDQIELPDLPMLTLRPELPQMPKMLQPGVEYSISLGTRDQRARVELADGPAGATVQDNRLHWMPGPQDVGLAKFQFKVSAEGSDLTQTHAFQCGVGVVSYPLSFRVTSMRISGDGKHAVAWTNRTESANDPRRFQKGRIAVLRTSDRHVLYEADLDTEISDVALTDQFVVLLALDRYSINVRLLSDWKLVSQHGLTAQAHAIETIAGKLIIDAEGLHLYSLPDLQPTPVSPLVSDRGYPLVSVVNSGGGWRLGNTWLDDSLSKPLVIDRLQWSGVIHLNDSLFRAKPIVDSPYSRSAFSGVTHHLGNGQSRDRLPESMIIGDHTVSFKETRVSYGNIELPWPQSILRVDANANGNTQSANLTCYHGSGFRAYLTHAADVTLVTVNSGLYSFDLNQLGIDVGSAVSEEELVVRTDPLITQISSPGTNIIKVSIDGGTPPYTWVPTFALPKGTASSDVVGQDWVQAEDDSIRVDGKKILEFCTTKQKSGYFNIDVATLFWPTHRSLARLDAERVLKEYALRMREQLGPFLRAPLRGIPVCALVAIKATDSNGKTGTIHHPLIVDLPAKDFMAFAKKASEQSDQYVNKQEESGRVVQQREPFSLQTLRKIDPLPNQITKPDPNLPLVWNAETPSEVSQALRAMWPPRKIDLGDYTVEGLAARSVLEKMEPLSVDAQLKWSHRDGRKFTNQLRSVSRGQLGFRVNSRDDPRGVNLIEMDNASLISVYAVVQQQVPPVEPRQAASPYPRNAFRRWDRLGNAIDLFYRDFGCLPPAAIVDDSGKPLLSWRVMLLPYLGYEKLFQLFRLNEPWDSPHNKKLIPFMPPIEFAPLFGDDLKAGQATMQAIVGAETSFPPDQLRRTCDYKDDFRNALHFVISNDQNAVTWTQPRDLAIDDPGLGNQLFLKTVPGKTVRGQRRPEMQHFFGVFADCQLSAAPFDLSTLKASATTSEDGDD